MPRYLHRKTSCSKSSTFAKFSSWSPEGAEVRSTLDHGHRCQPQRAPRKEISFSDGGDVCLPPSRSLSGMPRGPRGEKRPADVIGNAVHVMRIATGEIEDNPSKAPKRAKGGKARAKSLTPIQRTEIARAAASARWKKPR